MHGDMTVQNEVTLKNTAFEWYYKGTKAESAFRPSYEKFDLDPYREKKSLIWATFACIVNVKPTIRLKVNYVTQTKHFQHSSQEALTMFKSPTGYTSSRAHGSRGTGLHSACRAGLCLGPLLPAENTT